jgi:hypothetical protein
MMNIINNITKNIFLRIYTVMILYKFQLIENFTPDIPDVLAGIDYSIISNFAV